MRTEDTEDTGINNVKCGMIGLGCIGLDWLQCQYLLSELHAHFHSSIGCEQSMWTTIGRESPPMWTQEELINQFRDISCLIARWEASITSMGWGLTRYPNIRYYYGHYLFADSLGITWLIFNEIWLWLRPSRSQTIVKIKNNLLPKHFYLK